VLCTLHNLHFYQRLMRRVRAAIEAGRLESFAREFLGPYLSDGCKVP
jgi:queuine tRNA-ribosyltransferase